MKFSHILTISITAACLTVVGLAVPLAAKSSEAAARPVRPLPPTPAEATELYAKAAAFLRTAVEVESDAQASAHCVYRGRHTRVEWRNLVFRQLILGSVSEKDRKNGIGRRIYAQLESEAYRLSNDTGTTEWRSGRFQGFPCFVVIEEIGGELRFSSPGIDQFAPSPGRLAVPPTVPQGGDENLVANRF